MTHCSVVSCRMYQARRSTALQSVGGGDGTSGPQNGDDDAVHISTKQMCAFHCKWHVFLLLYTGRGHGDMFE